MTKFPQLRAPIKQADKAAPSTGMPADIQHDPPSSSISNRMKAFENNVNDTSKNLPERPSKQFGNLPPSDQSTKVGNKSPKLPSKFPKSPELPPKNPNMLNSAATKSHNQTEDNDNALSNMPAHLRSRFMKSKEQSKQRKLSKSQEDAPHIQEAQDPTPELPSQQKPIAKNPFLQKQLLKAPKGSESSDTTGKSIKDRMKMFSNSSVDEPTPPVSPGSQKWPPSNSFEKKQPGISSKPPVEDAKPSKMLPPKIIPESKKPFIPNGKEMPSVPPLPDRNTKPPKFSGSKSGDISKRPPMPLPPVSYADVSDVMYL